MRRAGKIAGGLRRIESRPAFNGLDLYASFFRLVSYRSTPRGSFAER
jgi:hypothetical protein